MYESVNSRTVRLLLERYGYYFYVIKKIPETKCKCVNITSNSPDPKCKECLGTGAKIKIFKVYGAVREVKERESNVTGNISTTPKVAYIKGFYRFEKDDIVRIVAPDGTTIGYGRAAYSAAKARTVMGCKAKRPLVHYDYRYVE